MASARERGRRVHCAGNLRQLTLAAVLYAEDNGERLPSYFNIQKQGIGGGGGAGQYKIDIKYNPQAMPALKGNKGVLVCLSDKPPASIPIQGATGNVKMSYAYNFFLDYYRYKLSSLPAAQTAVFFDGLPDGGNLGGGWWLDDPHGNKSKNAKTINQRATELRHTGKMNVSFLDAHIEYLPTLPDNSIY
jgi:prepilin-type processing-associated H-X9-DG protein